MNKISIANIVKVITEAIKAGYHVDIIINGEYYDITTEDK